MGHVGKICNTYGKIGNIGKRGHTQTNESILEQLVTLRKDGFGLEKWVTLEEIVHI